jgi:hypothetical protein
VRPTFAFAPDAWDQPPEQDAPDRPYACDGCGDLLPQSELHRVRSTSGETDQCERCLGMADKADADRDDAFDRECEAKR